jgi:4'-phosphopantetheinyl transferase
MPAASPLQPPWSETGAGDWTPGPVQPMLAPDVVHVWRADLTVVGEQLCDLLNGEERARAERMLTGELERTLWMRSRGLLRALLGRYLREDPAALRFATGAHGKPHLVDDASAAAGRQLQLAHVASRIQFNLSHSAGLALYALAHRSSVGVDVELARRPIDTLAIAARVFGAAEVKRLGQLGEQAREREFLRMWVRYEAGVKCLGVGLGGADARDDRDLPWIADLQLGPGAAAAVAADTPPRELRCWEWLDHVNAPLDS